MRVFAISGSLRAASYNTALLRAAVHHSPAGIELELYADLGSLPLFNPDFEIDSAPLVACLRTKLMAADAVLIASPEYAHGVTGALKNALDWMVSSEAFVDKPVALLNTSARAFHAQASLKETLTVMSALLIEEASITLPILGSGMDEAAMFADTNIAKALREVLLTLQIKVAASY
ncbi:MAG: NADPH-dependent FMN reductase [Gallionellaceae bacterium]